MTLILLILIVVLLLGGGWGYQAGHAWNSPLGILLLVVLIVLLLSVFGGPRFGWWS